MTKEHRSLPPSFSQTSHHYVIPSRMLATLLLSTTRSNAAGHHALAYRYSHILQSLDLLYALALMLAYFTYARVCKGLCLYRFSSSWGLVLFDGSCEQAGYCRSCPGAYESAHALRGQFGLAAAGCFMLQVPAGGSLPSSCFALISIAML